MIEAVRNVNPYNKVTQNDGLYGLKSIYILSQNQMSEALATNLGLDNDFFRWIWQ